MIRETIQAKLTAAFAPVHLEIQDESHRHNVPAGAESHFKVVIVSDSFLTLRSLMRHRAVYAALAEELAGSVHALALHTCTPDEWEKQHGSVPASPNCRGAGTLA